MQKCLICNHVNEEGAKYCSSCGNVLDTSGMVVNILHRLDSQSSSEEIYAAMRTVLRIGYEDSKRTNDEIRAIWEEYKVRNPIRTSTQAEADCCYLISKSIDEFHNLSLSIGILQRFLVEILIAAWQNLNPKEFQEACDKIMGEFYNDIVKIQSVSLDKFETELVGIY